MLIVFIVSIGFGCNQFSKEDRSELGFDNSAEILPLPKPSKQPIEEPQYTEDSSELGTDSSDWAESIRIPYVDFDPVIEKTVRKNNIANKLTTPKGYTIYLIDNYTFHELVGGIKVFPGDTNDWRISTLSLEIKSYEKGTDIKEKISEWMQSQDTTFSNEENLDNPEISYIAYGIELPGNTGRRTKACILEKASPQTDEIVVAYMIYMRDYPELLENLDWMAKTFRKN